MGHRSISPSIFWLLEAVWEEMLRPSFWCNHSRSVRISYPADMHLTSEGSRRYPSLMMSYGSLWGEEGCFSGLGMNDCSKCWSLIQISKNNLVFWTNELLSEILVVFLWYSQPVHANVSLYPSFKHICLDHGCNQAHIGYIHHSYTVCAVGHIASIKLPLFHSNKTSLLSMEGPIIFR